ncbi:MAG: GNAT family N-acetyltransferase [Rhizobiaceae bacterium]|nr:GNAT family N-acetyltransferase [Rhizobiaceae bacterium]
MPSVIRPAEPRDVDALLAIETRVFPGDRLSPRAFARLVGRPSAAVLVADTDGAVSGYAVVLMRRNSKVARLYSIASVVHGQGSALLEAAQEVAAARGAERLRLEVRRDNARAIAFYRRHGFEPIGERLDYYEDGMAALRFEKRLARPPQRAARRLPAAHPA